jgi:flagellar basal body-associated protein FliL
MSAPVEHEKKDRPKRSRIVVDFDKAKQMALHPIDSLPRRGSRAARILLILALVFGVLLVSLAVGGYFYWQSYKTRPAYSLALLVDATQRNDQAVFDQLVDIDKIVTNFVPQVTEKALGQYAAALTAPLRKQVEQQVPKLVPGVKQKVREEVAKQVKEMSERAGNYPFPIVALGVPYVVTIKEEADKAIVDATLKDRPVQLTMQRTGDLWKIVAVKDDALASRIVDEITKNLPAIGSELEREIRRNLPAGVPDIPLLGGQGDNQNSGQRRRR